MARPGDPKGHYARLGIAVWATQQAIDIAFQERTRELEPDRKPPPDAAERRQAIVEAHRTLSIPELRRAYDAESAIPDEDDTDDEPATAPPALPWYRQRALLFAIVASATMALIVAAIVRAPEPMLPAPMLPAPDRALTPPPMPVVPRYERRVVTGSGVNLRVGPGTQYALTGRVARGETVDLLQPEAEGWAYVRLGDGRRGYIAARFLTAP